jgi:hypothetical protein
MRHSLRRSSTLLILVAGLAVFCAGALKWRRYVGLRERIATYSSLEKRLMDAYREGARIPNGCGIFRTQLGAYRAVAVEQRRLIESCEREIRRIW